MESWRHFDYKGPVVVSTPEPKTFTMTEEGLGQLRRRFAVRLLGIGAVATTAVLATWSLGANRLRLPVTALVMLLGLVIIARAMKRTVDRARRLKVGLDHEEIWLDEEGSERRSMKLRAIRRIIETNRGALVLRTEDRRRNLVVPGGLDDQGHLRELLQTYQTLRRPRAPAWLGGALWVVMIVLMVLGVSAHRLGVDWLAAPIGTIWSGIGLMLVAVAARSRDTKRRVSAGALGLIFAYLGWLYLHRAMGG